MKMRSAIVVGATGLVGSALVKLLCESDEYISVTVVARKKLEFQHAKLTVHVRQFDELTEEDLEFADDLFCCLGTTIKKAKSREVFEKVDIEYPVQIGALAKNRGVRHMIVISAMGANEGSFAYYNRVKGKLEKELIELDLPQLSIVRPSLLVGDRKEFRLGEKIGELAFKIGNPLLVGPLKNYRSIKAEQVARAMKIIALYGKKEKVAIFSSKELAMMEMPSQEEAFETGQERYFDWNKHKLDGLAPLDEEVIFDKEKLKNLEVEPNKTKD